MFSFYCCRTDNAVVSVVAGAFVKLWLMCAGEKLASRRTKTQHNTSCPSFNQQFVFELESRDAMT